MLYRIETGDPDNIKTEYPANRAAALGRARKLSVGAVAYVVGFTGDRDIGQIVYARGHRFSTDGERV